MSTLQIAKMEIVGNEWQEMGIVGPDTSEQRFFTGTRIDDTEPQFQIAVINTEDNADYIPPKGVKGEYDRINEIQGKEQSLVLKFSNLPAQHTGIAPKDIVHF